MVVRSTKVALWGCESGTSVITTQIDAEPKNHVAQNVNLFKFPYLALNIAKSASPKSSGNNCGLLESEGHRHGVLNAHGLTTLLTRNPLRHQLQHTHCLLVERGINRLDDLDVGD